MTASPSPVAAPLRLQPPSPLARRIARGVTEGLPFETLLDLMASDPALTVRLLRVVNSPYFGLSRPVASVRAAALILGERAIQRLAIGAAFAAQPLAARLPAGLQSRVWRHSVEAGCVAAKLLGTHELAGSALAAGLLQDLGHLERALAPANAYPSTAAPAWNDAGAAALSAEIVLVWQLPQMLADAVRAHVCPRAPDGPLAQALWLANRLIHDDLPGTAMAGIDIALGCDPGQAMTAAQCDIDMLAAMVES
jgi:HD-like signal output (HDOD) protein